MKISFCRYEYVYGINPFENQNYRIMQALIKRYPVAFPDSGNAAAKSAEEESL